MANDGKTNPFGNGNGGARGGGARPLDLTRPSPPPTSDRERPNPQSIPAGGDSVFPAIDANAGGPAKGSPATIGRPGSGAKSFRLTGG